MLLAMIAGGIIMSVEFPSGAVSDRMRETALWYGGDGCGGDGCGDGTGGAGGSGQGGESTC